MKKRCIFHIPFQIDENNPSGTNIRPLKILQAFKNMGYYVDIVSGYGKERKKNIKDIKNNIKNGVRYEFMYSESSTMPTLLTEKHHLPIYPFLDFNFFKFCKKNNIRVGLFYRDIYWRFDRYKQEVPFIKRFVAISMYKYDLYIYSKYIDILYLPSYEMSNYLPKNTYNIKQLYPAIDSSNKNSTYTNKSNILSIFYVGGINKDYNLKMMTRVVSKFNNIELTICCRENEWNKERNNYDLSDNINVIHKKGNEIMPYINNSDICTLFVEPIEYRKFAVPVKLFEYISYNKPILATKKTKACDIIEEFGIGWSVDYDEEKLEQFLIELHKNKKNMIEEKLCSIEKIINKNTWEARAKQVKCDMEKLNKNDL